MRVPLVIHTKRLKLVAVTRELAVAAVEDRARLGSLLGAEVPSAWPNVDLADVLPMFARTLSEHPEYAGWNSWHVLAGESVGLSRTTLVGGLGVGAFTPPDSHPPREPGTALVGYGILEPFQRRGIATEGTLAVMKWALHHPNMREFQATTFEEHWASRKVLERCGFEVAGVSPDDDKASEADRQGRGRLLLFRRSRESLEAENGCQSGSREGG